MRQASVPHRNYSSRGYNLLFLLQRRKIIRDKNVSFSWKQVKCFIIFSTIVFSAGNISLVILGSSKIGIVPASRRQINYGYVMTDACRRGRADGLVGGYVLAVGKKWCWRDWACFPSGVIRRSLYFAYRFMVPEAMCLWKLLEKLCRHALTGGRQL